MTDNASGIAFGKLGAVSFLELVTLRRAEKCTILKIASFFLTVLLLCGQKRVSFS